MAVWYDDPDTRFYMNYAATRNANPQPLGNVIVAKFGGTSVADFDAMNRSADIVLSRPEVRLVVLSASAGVTN